MNQALPPAKPPGKPPLHSVTLYDGKNYTGASLDIPHEGQKQLGPFDGKASSLRIHVQRWVRFHTYANWEGRFLEFRGPVGIPDLEKYGRELFGDWNDEIASVEVMPPSYHGK